MAVFHNKSFLKYDEYMTPKYAWENIQHFIPKDKVIWEAFYGDGTSGNYLKELGYKVIHEPVDFFENNLGDIIVSNPPFSNTKEIMTRLFEIDKPFIILLSQSKLFTQYLQKIIKDKKIQLIIPKKRIHFTKLVDGKVPDKWKNSCNFDCLYYCYKMNLSNDLNWLN
jgi:hypothetical protein